MENGCKIVLQNTLTRVVRLSYKEAEPLIPADFIEKNQIIERIRLSKSFAFPSMPNMRRSILMRKVVT